MRQMCVHWEVLEATDIVEIARQRLILAGDDPGLDLLGEQAINVERSEMV